MIYLRNGAIFFLDKKLKVSSNLVKSRVLSQRKTLLPSFLQNMSLWVFHLDFSNFWHCNLRKVRVKVVVRELQWGNLEGFGESISLHQEPRKQPASASSISSSQNKPVVQQQSNRKIGFLNEKTTTSTQLKLLFSLQI